MATKISMLPAANGDCFVVEFDVKGRSVYRMLVDGGPKSAYEHLHQYFSDLGECDRYIDLIVVTHIDEDHIGGVLELLKDKELKVDVREIWFNDIDRAENPDGKSKAEKFGVKHGIELAELIPALGIPWNSYTNGGAICISSTNIPVERNLADNASVAILGPSRPALLELAKKWTTYEEMQKKKSEKKEPSRIEKFGSSSKNWERLAQSDFSGDDSVTNLSSIAFVLKTDDAQIFFSGDAGVETVNAALQNWSARPDEISVFKVSHHGSAGNTNEALLRRLPARHYLFSANGRHHHPSLEAIARVVKFGGAAATLHFSHNHLEVAMTATDFQAFASKSKVQFANNNTIVIEF